MINKRHLINSLIVVLGFSTVAALVFSSVDENVFSFFNIKAETEPYQLVLDKNNKYSGGEEEVKYTKIGNQVTFTYSDCSSINNNHVQINDGGYLVNKDHIRSISSFKAVFAGELTAKVSYDNKTWGGTFDLVSGQIFELSSNPYFIYLAPKSGNVTLESATYNYSCVINPNAHEDEDPEQEKKIASADYFDKDNVTETGCTDVVNADYLNAKMNVLTKASTEVISSVTADTVYQKRYGGFGMGSGKHFGSLKIELNDGYKTNKIEITAIGVDNTTTTFDVNGITSSTLPKRDGKASDYNKAVKSTFIFDSLQSKITIENDAGNRIGIYTITLYVTGVGPDIPTPVDEIGFSAIDTKVNLYKATSVFDTDNGLSVSANYSDGTSATLGKDKYSYVIKNASGNPIDTSKAFGEGTFNVFVSYKNYIPVKYQIVIAHESVLQSISLDSTKTTFTTANKLSDYYSNISATLTYDDKVESNVAYSDFASKGLSLELINPSGVTSSQTSPFAVPGTWKLKLRNSLGTISDTLSITVEAIPVTNITIDKTSLELEVGKKAQLTVTNVEPIDATNKNYGWSSTDITIASVSDTGLVTAIEEGECDIRATAKDGSGVYGSCHITVSEHQKGEDEGNYTYLDNGAPAIGSYILIAYCSDLTSDTAMVMSKTQNTNNRPAVEASMSDQTISKTSDSDFAAFKVEEGTKPNTYSFYDPNLNGYLAAASSSKNYLYTVDTKTDNASFTISNGGNATITAQGTYSHDVLQYNTNNDLFSCYTNTQKAVHLFVKGGEIIYPTAVSLTGESEISVGSATKLVTTLTPSNTNYIHLSYESSDMDVATVSGDGTVTGRKTGNATITVTAQTKDPSSPVSATHDITVKTISVTSVSLDKSDETIGLKDTLTLTATVLPNNATDKTVTWSTSDNGVATVSDGVVTPVSAGEATITVTTNDGKKTATCKVTVKTSGGGGGDNCFIEFDNSEEDGTTALTNLNIKNHITSGYGYIESFTDLTKVFAGKTGLKLGSGSAAGVLEFNVTSSVYDYKAYSVSIACDKYNDTDGGTLDIYVNDEFGTSVNPADQTGTYTFDEPTKITSIKIATSTKRAYLKSITINCKELTPIPPTGISLDKTSLELAKSESENLNVIYSPSDCNTGKGIAWKSSNTSVATVDSSGKVTASSTASIGSSCTITATSTYNADFKATCNVKIVDTPLADQTLLLYLCGADLESGSHLATGDITEILNVEDQPDDVNIVIETGGAKSWSSTYGINANYLQRWHVRNQKLVLDSNLTRESMGKSSTLQSFITWGTQQYPATRMALEFWDHGGDIYGCCYDENYKDDSLINSEVKSALSNSFSALGRSTSNNKFEWVGYDCCLMALQDIADFNSTYFNYMVSSEESESGYGWDYDSFVDDMYDKDDTETILKEICDTFIREQGYSSDQTLSVMKLSQMATYKNAWENLASALSNKLGITSKSTFAGWVVGNVKHYSGDDYDYFAIFDARDFVNKLSNNSSYNPGSTYTNAVKNAHDNLVIYNKAGSAAGNSYGVAMFYANDSYYKSYYSTYYSTSETNFSNWRNLNKNYGYLQ